MCDKYAWLANNVTKEEVMGCGVLCSPAEKTAWVMANCNKDSVFTDVSKEDADRCAAKVTFETGEAYISKYEPISIDMRKLSIVRLDSFCGVLKVGKVKPAFEWCAELQNLFAMILDQPFRYDVATLGNGLYVLVTSGIMNQ